MNYEEKDLSPTEQTKFDTNEARITRLEERNSEIDEKIGKINESDDEVSKKLDRKKEKLETVQEELNKADSINARVKKTLKNVASKHGNLRKAYFTRSGVSSKDIITISLPGGISRRTSDGPLNNLARQINVFMALADCPFPDSGYSDDEKVELITSIMGRKNPLLPDRDTILNSVDRDNKALDTDWEVKEDDDYAAGVKEPADFSYEWFKRWWKFHQYYAKTSISFGSEEDYRDYLPLNRPVMTEGSISENTEYRDAFKFLKDKDIYKDLTWAEDRILKPQGSKRMKYLYTQSAVGKNPNMYTHKNFFRADLIYYLRTILNTDTIDSDNLLFNNNGHTLPGKTQPVQYLLKPDALRDQYKFDTLHIILWKPKDSNDTTFEFDKHVTKAIVGARNSLDGWNYLRLNDNSDYLYTFTGIAPGFKGLAEVIGDVFFKNNIIQKTFYADSPKIMTVPNYKFDEKKSTFDLWTISSVDVDTLKEKKRKLKKDIAELSVEIDEKDRKILAEERNQNLKDIRKLRKENDELKGTSEKKLLQAVVKISGWLDNNFKKPTPQRKDFGYYQRYESLIKRLQEKVKERLKVENKWKDNDSEYKDFNLLSDKIDSYFKDKDEVKKNLLLIRSGWKCYDNNVTDEKEKGILQKTKDVRAELFTLYTMHKLNREVKQLEEWLKDTKNGKAAEKILQCLDELVKHIALDEFETSAREKIRDSDITAKNLEATLRDILKKDKQTYKPAILKAWQKAGYGEGNKLYELITYKTDLRTDKNFMDWLKNKTDEGSPGYSKSFGEWIAEKSTDELKSDILAYIFRYRLIEFIRATIEERSEFKKETVLNWIEQAKELGSEPDTFADIVGGDSKNGEVVLNNFVKNRAKSRAEIMNLSVSNSAEYNIAKKWMGYKEEDIKKIKGYMDEKFMEGKDPKKVWDAKPEELHKEACNHQINNEGITNEEELAKVQDKEKLERVIALYDDLIEHKLATPEQIEFKPKLNSYLVSLQSKEKTAPPTETPTEETPTEETPTTPTTGDGDSKGQAEPKWYQRYYGAAIWVPILLLVGVGAAVWYFMSGKKSGSEEGEEETETE